MTSWVTYARPFAKRIRTYRKIIDIRLEMGDYDYAGEDYILAVYYTWADFKAHMGLDREQPN